MSCLGQRHCCGTRTAGSCAEIRGEEWESGRHDGAPNLTDVNAAEMPTFKSASQPSQKSDSRKESSSGAGIVKRDGEFQKSAQRSNYYRDLSRFCGVAQIPSSGGVAR